MGSKNVLDKNLPALVVTHGHSDNKHLPLSFTGVALGRERGCDIQLDAPEVSGVHCLISRGGGLHVRDCKSRTGTHVNGERVQESPLRNGDILQVGPFSFEVYLPESYVLVQGDSDPDQTKTRRQLELERQKMAEERRRVEQRDRDLDERIRKAEFSLSRERAKMAEERVQLERLRKEILFEVDRAQRNSEPHDRLTGVPGTNTPGSVGGLGQRLRGMLRR